MNVIFTIFNDLLNVLFNISGDYGIAIILLTILVRTMLLPIAIKQRKSLKKQQELSKKVHQLKEKYNQNKEKLNEELQKLYMSNSSSILGCLPMILQIPVMYSLYKVFSTMAVEVGTKVIPWVSTLKISDPYFILPIAAALIQLLPNILSTLGILKNIGGGKLSLGNVIMIGAVSVLFLARAPIAVGIYFITTSLYSTVEQIGYSIYTNKKCIA
ncbi:YidC/Oxa1 family membrane protein insertase [Clostridium ganghwense]|uniref:YidC/Oxa1 family membrane protein insertase n=1 Tax=Clostridium ganghwense TaxID=312089 RepID=A0ABT4CNZ9_9CLOT|nr:YidC/Oxa1 family membrane protein insertase [Clostridium ganghwense]MCY6370785.1 YidC/Oxa1 family membrane protein insertase [Clostridium ganghwense]